MQIRYVVHWTRITYFDLIGQSPQICITPTFLAPMRNEWTPDAGVEQYESLVLFHGITQAPQCVAIGTDIIASVLATDDLDILGVGR